MLGNEVTIKVLQGHFGHGDPLLGVVTHGEAGALAGHRHDVPAKGKQPVKASSKDTVHEGAAVSFRLNSLQFKEI